jgi:hypothetical protein
MKRLTSYRKSLQKYRVWGVSEGVNCKSERISRRLFQGASMVAEAMVWAQKKPGHGTGLK